MHLIVMLGIIFGGSILVLAIIGSTILMGLKILRGGVSRKGRAMQSEEAKTVQEVYKGLSRLEERMEALETILMERDGKEQR